MKKRLTFATLALLTFPAFGLVTSHAPRPGDRIGILRIDEHFLRGVSPGVASTLRATLREELSKAGFEAAEVDQTYEQISRDDSSPADYYVEILGADGETENEGGAGVNLGNVGVELGVVMTRVAAGIRMYDGRTLEVLHTYDLKQSSHVVAPTGIGLVDRNFFGFIAVPLIQRVQFRSMARNIAHQAAQRILESRD